MASDVDEENASWSFPNGLRECVEVNGGFDEPVPEIKSSDPRDVWPKPVLRLSLSSMPSSSPGFLGAGVGRVGRGEPIHSSNGGNEGGFSTNGEFLMRSRSSIVYLGPMTGQLGLGRCPGFYESVKVDETDRNGPVL